MQCVLINNLGMHAFHTMTYNEKQPTGPPNQRHIATPICLKHSSACTCCCAVRNLTKEETVLTATDASASTAGISNIPPSQVQLLHGAQHLPRHAMHGVPSSHWQATDTYRNTHGAAMHKSATVNVMCCCACGGCVLQPMRCEASAQHNTWPRSGIKST